MADRRCAICGDFVTSDREIMKRHVGIVHGKSAFSTFQCGVCERKYYDFDHFKADHIQETTSCSSESLKATPIPLAQEMEDAFASLVEEIMKPVQVESDQFPSIDGQSSAANNVGQISNRVSTDIESGTGGNQKQIGCKPSGADLRLHCRNIILKRHRNNRLICSICKESMVAIVLRGPHCPITLQHAQYHADPPIFKCKLCDFTSNCRLNILVHVKSQHSASDQYIDKTGDRIEELMQLATQCFDHDSHKANSPVAHPITSRLQLQKETLVAGNGADEANVDGSGSNSASPLRALTTWIAESRKRRLDGTVSSGSKSRSFSPFIEQSKTRNAIDGNEKRKCSMTLEKNNTGRFETVGASELSNTPKQCSSKGSGVVQGRCIRQISVLPAHLRAEKVKVVEQVMKYVKDGQLECNICRQRITISPDDSDLVCAFDHAMAHLRIVGLFECTSCDYRTSDISSMYLHLRKKHIPGYRKFIDRTNEHYPKILQQFLDCFSEPSAVGTDGRQKRSAFPAHIVSARRACYNKVKEYIDNGKLFCQLCSQWIVVESTSDGIGYVMDRAVAHVTTHVEGCHLFECSNCHVVAKTRASMYYHIKKCPIASPANYEYIDHSNQYYKEILAQFMTCFDLKKTGVDTEQSIQSTGDGNGSGEEGERMGETSPMDSTDV